MGATPKDAARTGERFTRLHVACLEADWSSRLDNQQTVLPLLELCERQGWIRFLHRRVRDPDDLLTDLEKLTSQAQYQRYRLYFVASHGAEGSLTLGTRIPISALGEIDLSGRVLYL